MSFTNYIDMAQCQDNVQKIIIIIKCKHHYDVKSLKCKIPQYGQDFCWLSYFQMGELTCDWGKLPQNFIYYQYALENKSYGECVGMATFL